MDQRVGDIMRRVQIQNFTNVRQLGHADATRLFHKDDNENAESRFILRAPSFIQNRMILPPCDVGSRDQSSKQRGIWVRLGPPQLRFNPKFPGSGPDLIITLYYVLHSTLQKISSYN